MLQARAVGGDAVIVRKIVDRYKLNVTKMQLYRHQWRWSEMKGSAACLKWSFRDLQNLERTLGFVKGRSVAVQAGGNLGLFPKRLAESFAFVLSFEPDPQLFEWAKHNAPEPNIKFVRAAIGNSRESVSLSQKRRDTSGRPTHEGLTHVCGRGDIRQVMIDDYDLKACDLIYLDIEGYELNALKGGIKTIQKFRPVIAVEINRNINYYGTKPDELRSWIIGLGYRFVFSMNSDEVFVPC
jgi:FkbM family methyltransferase